MIQQAEKAQIKKSNIPLLLFGMGFCLLLILGLMAVFQPLWLEGILGDIESWYGNLLSEQTQLQGISLIFFALLGGFLGSISPCILAMLPMNLGYIGTLKIESRWDALRRASAFVAGVVLITSLFGLMSGFAQAVMVFYKGYLLLTVAILILIMAASMLEWIHLPLPRVIQRVPDAGPFVVGMAFALISSPCASPVLFGVLAMAATSEQMLWSILTMAAYGIGYSALIFLASLFTGLSKQVSGLKYHGTLINQISASVLLLAGVWAFYQGLQWFLN